MRRRANEGRREFEKRMAAALQSRFKGWLWRVRLRRMGEASVVAQTLYRGYAARRLREAEERRRLEGLPVYEVYQRGMTVSGVPLIVTVKKCGLSYKFIGHDLEKCTTYYGYVYGSYGRLALFHHFVTHPNVCCISTDVVSYTNYVHS